MDSNQHRKLRRQQLAELRIPSQEYRTRVLTRLSLNQFKQRQWHLRQRQQAQAIDSQTCLAENQTVQSLAEFLAEQLESQPNQPLLLHLPMANVEVGISLSQLTQLATLLLLSTKQPDRLAN